MSRNEIIILNEHRLATPIGAIIFLADQHDHVRALNFADCEQRMIRSLDRLYGSKGWIARAATETSAATARLRDYFRGDVRALDAIRVETGGSDFQRQVWSALRGVPAGVTRSYGTLARTIGRPSAIRAVGHANGANPISIIVPCHRLVGSSGALTGYGGGIERKKWLLDHEAHHSAAAAEHAGGGGE